MALYKDRVGISGGSAGTPTISLLNEESMNANKRISNLLTHHSWAKGSEGYSLTYWLTYSPTHSLAYLLTHWLTYSLTHSPTYSLTLTHSLTHSLTYLLTHFRRG